MFSGVADVGFAGVFVRVCSLDGPGCSGEGSVVRLIILWILSRGESGSELGMVMRVLG